MYHLDTGVWELTYIYTINIRSKALNWKHIKHTAKELKPGAEGQASYLKQ